MGRRSRKRAVDEPRVREAPAAAPPTTPATPRLRARSDEAPKAPWHPIPLVELSVLGGIILIVVGFTRGGEDRMVLLVGGFTLASMAGLEVSIREHFSGFRSHTTLLAAVSALLVAVPLWFTPLPQEGILIAAVLAAAVAFRLLRRQFARKAGGLTWRA